MISRLGYAGVLILCLCSGAAFSQEPLAPSARNQQASRVQQTPATSPPPGHRTNTISSNPITPRQTASETNRESQAASAPYSLWKIFGALTIAVAGIFGVAKLFKTFGPFSSVEPLPNAVCDVLGVMTLPPRHTLYFLRVGQRILVMNSSADGLANLAEISDPQEVASLTTLCRSKASPPSNDASFFNRVLNQIKGETSPDTPPLPHESDARQELEAKFQSFAHSSSQV